MKSKQPKFKSQFFFEKVRDSFDTFSEDDLDKLGEAVVDATDYYQDAVKDAQQHLHVNGELTSLMAETPGLVAFYGAIRTDALQVRKWLEMVFDQRFAERYKWIKTDEEAIEDYGSKLGSTDASNYAKADAIYNLLYDMVRLAANAQHQLEVVMEALDKRGMALSKISDLRNNGIEEVWLDPPRKQ